MINIATIAELMVKIGANSQGLRKELAATQRQMKRAFGDEALGVSETAAGMIAGFAAALGAAGIASIKMAGDMQASSKAFETLIGDSQKAKEFLSDLSQFAAETPFELKGLQDAAKRLLAFKFAAQDIIPIMAVIGDTAGMLGSGQEGIDRMITSIAQMQAKGKVQAEEVMQLAEAGVNAWQYLAGSMNMSVAEVMDKVTKGEVDAQKGINAILMGMQKDFQGGMKAQAQEIPGLFSTIKDNVAAVSKEIGAALIDNLGIKKWMKDLADSLGQFASYVKTSGINQALRDLIPKELTLAIFVLAGVIAGAAVGALVLFKLAISTATAAIGPYLAAGAAVAALAWVLWQAWNPLADMFAQTWAKIVARGQQSWYELKRDALMGVQNVLAAIQPLLTIFNGSLTAMVNDWMHSTAAAITEADQEMKLAAVRGEIAGNALAQAWENSKTAIVGGATETANAAKALATEFTGLTNASDSGVGAGLGSGADKAAQEWEKLQDKAKQVSESIEREWVQTTKTQLEQLDIWKTEQIAALDETKEANENYERDKERVAAVYSIRRTKILQQEAADALSLYNKMRDGYQSMQSGISGYGLTGSYKDDYDMAMKAQGRLKEISKYYADIQAEYTGADDAKKQRILDNLYEMKIAYQVNEQGNLDFTKQIAKQSGEVWEQAEAERTKYFETGQGIRAELQAAYDAYDMERYMTILNEQNAAKLSQLEGEQAMMDLYRQVQMDANRSAISYIAEAYGTLYSSMTNAFAGLLTGAKSISQAFADIGKSIINMIAQWAAQWIASRLMMAIFGKKTMAVEVATGTAAAAALAAAWSGAAAMVSLATFGANSAPAIAGMTAATVAAYGLSIPKLASGGITTGPTLAMIGEGRYQEAVLPLNQKALEKAGIVNTEQPVQQGDQYSIIIQALDGPSVDNWLEGGGGTKIIKHIKQRIRGFAVGPSEVRV